MKILKIRVKIKFGMALLLELDLNSMLHPFSEHFKHFLGYLSHNNRLSDESVKQPRYKMFLASESKRFKKIFVKSD